MKITIFNGNPDFSNSGFDGYMQQLSDALVEDGYEVKILPLRDMDIRQCLGCFDCWVKTPGECIQKDEGSEVCRAMIKSDFVLFSAPIVMGFPSALLKRVLERTIPLLLPYFRIVNGEVRHPPRYEKFPLYGLLMQEESGTDEEDLSIIEDIFHQLTLEWTSTLSFAKLMSSPLEEVVNAINAV